jgi:hypothetical protein
MGHRDCLTRFCAHLLIACHRRPRQRLIRKKLGYHSDLLKTKFKVHVVISCPKKMTCQFMFNLRELEGQLQPEGVALILVVISWV